MKTETGNILAEEFETPTHLMDIEETIDQACDYYNANILDRRQSNLFRHKLNELIDKYNGMRNTKIFNHIK